MIAGLIAVLLLIGALFSGGDKPDRSAMPASDDSSVSNCLVEGHEKAGFRCADKALHVRDLTVPYESGSTRPSPPVGDRDD